MNEDGEHDVGDAGGATVAAQGPGATPHFAEGPLDGLGRAHPLAVGQGYQEVDQQGLDTGLWAGHRLPFRLLPLDPPAAETTDGLLIGRDPISRAGLLRTGLTSAPCALARDLVIRSRAVGPIGSLLRPVHLVWTDVREDGLHY